MSFSSTNKFQTNFLCSKSHEFYLVLLNSILQSWNCQTDFCCVVMLNMLRLKCFNLRLWFQDKFEIWLIELKHKSMLLGQHYEWKWKTSTDRNFLTGSFCPRVLNRFLLFEFYLKFIALGNTMKKLSNRPKRTSISISILNIIDSDMFLMLLSHYC